MISLIRPLAIFFVIFLLFFFQINAVAQLVTELYETCTAEEGMIARCGPGSNCFIMSKLPTCHCVIDVTTGLPLAGNPYKACTWDISGTWKLFSFIDHKSGFYREILSPASNEPFVIRLDRTDALLKTKYILGAIFIVTALTSFATGVCGRAFLDANDNTSIIFEQAEGFLDQNGRAILLRTNLLDTSLTKIFPPKNKLKDRLDLKGNWQKNDGAQVTISDLKRPHNWPNFFTQLTRHWSAYWFNDSGYGAPLIRLSTALFIDKTLAPEKAAFNTNARFIQVGWYGALNFGSSRITIYSPADGKPIFTLLRVDTLPQFTPLGATATSLEQAFAPTTKEIMMLPSSTQFQITVDQPETSTTPSPEKVENDPPPHVPANRFFGTAENDMLGDKRLRDAISAASNLLSGIGGFGGTATAGEGGGTFGGLGTMLGMTDERMNLLSNGGNAFAG